jgi:hypothetical protein
MIFSLQLNYDKNAILKKARKIIIKNYKLLERWGGVGRGGEGREGGELS